MAKNTKGGLGRGLNSLMGGYEAPVEPVAAPVEAPKREPLATARAAARPRIEGEVMREEDLPHEDRAVINTENRNAERARAVPTRATEPLSQKIAIKDVIAKEELIEENDGVTIKGVIERPARTAAPVSEPTSGLSNAAAAIKAVQEAAPAAPALAADAAAKESDEPVEHRSMDEVPLEMIHPNPDQPRMHFNKDELDELSASIQKDGLLQPILVREAANGYEIIAGERRWQACKLAGIKKVPVRIKEADDMKVLELALIENLQRSDLNPIEEAYGYKRMMERGGRTQSEVAAAVSKGRSTIANALRLLDLPEEAQQMLYEEKITAGHARAILSIPTEEGRLKLAEKLSADKISVREAESLARLITGRINKAQQPPKPPAPKFYKKAAKSLGTLFDTKVRVRSANGKNKIEIEFKDEEDLQRLFDMMNRASQDEE